HLPNQLRWALDPGRMGELYRLKWDQDLLEPSQPFRQVTPQSLTYEPEVRGLGDVVESALVKIGITKERVEKWVGAPCGCNERRVKLNALGSWAKRVIAGNVEKAAEFLSNIIGEDVSKKEESMNKIRWSYGVLTVPERRGAVLNRTIQSLKKAGFDQPHLFV